MHEEGRAVSAEHVVGTRRVQPAPLAIAVPASVATGLALGVALYRFPLPAALALGAGTGLVGLLALTLASRAAAIALGMALLGVVVVEPAPADAVFAVVIAVAAVTGRFHLRDAPRAVVGILAVLAALNLMSAVQVVDPGRAAVFFGITLYLAVLALWLPGYITSSGRARLVLRGYLVAAVTSAFIGVAALLAPVPGAELLTENDRARALFQDPNVFGPFLIPALLLLVEEMLCPRLLKARAATKALLISILTLGVLFSYSRGAWLNLAVALAVMGVVHTLRPGGARRALALLAVGAVAAGAAGAIIVATGTSDFLAERARPQTYDSERFSGQRAGLRPAEQYPFGAGPGQFESVAGISAHSTYARAAGEQGFPGLIVLLALLGYTLACAASNVVRGRSTYGIGSAALLGAWCGLLANSAFIDTLHWRHLWLLAGLIWAAGMRSAGPGR
jgi:O-antigen ligase